jgi:glycerol-3-phosphate dehydrogenase (NAD(P)+)
MMIFIDFMKGKKETVMGLAGIADLYVSADGGRNSKMGVYLGQGMSYSNAKKIKMPTVTIEGADLALEIGKKVKTEFNIKQLPLMIAIIDTICEEKPLTVHWKNFK